MITEQEAIQMRNYRLLVEGGREDLISREQRQWVLDLLIREKIPVPRDVYEGAVQGGFNVEDLIINNQEE